MIMAAEESPIRKLVAIDRRVHEPARLAVLVLLSIVERADFLYILDETGLSKGNLSSHMTKLEDAGLIKVEKAFFDKIPRTVYELTKEGSRALEAHREAILLALNPG
jgi:DNA-binding transcriptional ArsR family regulator